MVKVEVLEEVLEMDGAAKAEGRPAAMVVAMERRVGMVGAHRGAGNGIGKASHPHPQQAHAYGQMYMHMPRSAQTPCHAMHAHV